MPTAESRYLAVIVFVYPHPFARQGQGWSNLVMMDTQQALDLSLSISLHVPADTDCVMRGRHWNCDIRDQGIRDRGRH